MDVTVPEVPSSLLVTTRYRLYPVPVLGEFRMRRILVALAVVSIAVLSSSSASAGLFHRKSDCCAPAPVCCEPAPAPVCCDPAPSCGGRKHVGLFARLHARKMACCAPTTCCEPAPAPCCEPAPAPVCCEPAPTCCEAPVDCCGKKRHMGFFARHRARKAACCAPAPVACCDAPAPACGCN